MDTEFKKRLSDYFEAWELVDFLELTVPQIIEAFEDDLADKMSEVTEFMNYGE